MLDFPEWHKKNQIEECACDFQYFSLTSFYTNDVSKACSVCIHAYAEYRVKEALEDLSATIAAVHYHSLHQDPKDHIGVAAIFQTFADQCEEHIPELKRLRQPLPEYKEQQ